EASTGRLELPEDDEATIELFVHWLYGHLMHYLTTPEQVEHHISLICFARRIWLPELHNDCIDAVRSFYSSKYANMIAEMSPNPGYVALEAVSLAYNAVPKQTRLRFCFCLDVALVVSHKIRNGAADWMDAELSQLLQDGGDFASDFPKLLVYCNQMPAVHPGLTLTLQLYCSIQCTTLVLVEPPVTNCPILLPVLS
ncbi:MAG: hypothetical protein Q9226_009266, partial [Calogaya cf. arnoldii]